MFFGEKTNLKNSDTSSDESMIREKQIVKVNLSSLVRIDEISIGTVDRIESKSCKIHSNKIEVHTLDAE